MVEAQDGGDVPGMARTVFGVDPGLDGAVVVWEQGADGVWRAAQAWRMGTRVGLRTSGSSRRALREWAQRAGGAVAVIERPPVIPGKGYARSLLSQGFGVGWAAGFFAALGVETWEVEVRAWEAAVGVAGEPVKLSSWASAEERKRHYRAKEEALLERRGRRVRRQDPAWAWKHDGIVDAGLIGLAAALGGGGDGWTKL